MKVQKSIDVWLVQKRTARQIDLVQYDTGVQLVFAVQDFTIPDGTTATLYVQKPSGKFVYQEDDITVDGSTITIDLDNQAITEYGNAIGYQVQLTNDTDTVTTFTGTFRVEKSLADANATESTTVVRAFDEAVSDHVAEFQTKAEQIVAACIATIPDDYSTMEAKVNELANAFKGYLSGTVVAAYDVSPVEHNPAVKIHGKNVYNPDYVLSGRALDALCTWGNIVIDESATAKMLKPNTTYTLSFTAECVASVEYATFQFAGIGFILYNGGQEINIGRHWSTSEDDWLSVGETITHTRTFTTPSTLAGWCIMGYTQRSLDSDGNPVINTIKFIDLQIEEGDTATDYEAWLDPSTVTVKRYGKNLLKNSLTTSTSCGVTRTINSDGSITFHGTSTEVHGIGVNSTIYLPNGKYIITGGLSNLYLVIWGKSIETGSWVSISPDKGSGAEFVADNSLYACYLAQYQGLSGVAYCCRSYPMIRVASVEDDTYEKYVEATTHIPSADGTVSGMTSLSPSMTILTDTEGAIVECECNRDTNKVIEKLTNAITALGGTV